jgi:UDP-N-acetylmuramoyl-tripeptide--D-alanyl-D-alanine ligase
MNGTELLLTALWSGMGGWRAWRMARFYQIEEYMTDRYTRWLFAKRGRWFPQRPAVVMLLGIIGAAILQIIDLASYIDETLATSLHLLWWGGVALGVGWPERVKETKRPFVRTPRAMRLVWVALGVLVALGFFLPALMVSGERIVALSSRTLWGFFLFLLAPLSLPLANALLYPYEEAQRRKFREVAHAKLQAAQVTTIGITGSYGKTSTKTYLSHILNAKYKTLPTPKSYNTLMGVSRAINEELDFSTYRYFIAEMGAYIPGEIARICDLTHPQISIVSAVGPMHLERFKTIENIEKAKYEIIQGLPPDGVGVFNGDDFRVRRMAERGYPATRILVSREGLPQARFCAEDIRQTWAGLQFCVLDRQTGERADFQTSLVGLHNVTNILLATAVACHLGMTLAEVAAQVQTLQSAEHRLRVNHLPNGVTIIDDAYSANPVGVVSALEFLALNTNGRRIVITPGMVELGPLQDEENYKLGKRLTEMATDIVLVGIEQTRPLQRGVAETEFDPKRLHVFDTFDEARQWFQTEVRPGDAVLFLNDLPDTYL